MYTHKYTGSYIGNLDIVKPSKYRHNVSAEFDAEEYRDTMFIHPTTSNLKKNTRKDILIKASPITTGNLTKNPS